MKPDGCWNSYHTYVKLYSLLLKGISLTAWHTNAEVNNVQRQFDSTFDRAISEWSLILLSGAALRGWLPWRHLYKRNRNGLIGPQTSLFFSPSLLRGFLFLYFLGTEMKLPHSFPFAPNCGRFCSPADANETGSIAKMIQPRLMFFCGCVMWTFTVGCGLITFL